MSDLTSRFEVAQQDILNEFAQIEQPTYRTQVAKVIKAIRGFDQIKQNEIGVVIPSGTISGIDGIWSGFDGIFDVIIQGVVFADTTTNPDQTKLNTAISALTHDMLRVTATIMTKYIAGNSTRWNVLPKPFQIASGVDFGQQANQGVVLITFQIQLRSMDNTFA